MKRLLSLVTGCLLLCSAMAFAANDDSKDNANDNGNKVECCCGQCNCPDECQCPENCENCDYCGKQQYCNDCCYRHCDDGQDNNCRYHRHHRHGGCCRPCN